MSENSIQFKVRDERKAGHHWADNEIIDNYGSRIGPIAYAIYMFIGRWAGNRTGRCAKTQKEIAAAFGLTRETVNRYIRKLTDEKLIAIENDGFNNCTYVILEVDKTLVTKNHKACDPESHPCDLKSQPLSELITPLCVKVTSNKEERLSSKLITKQGENSDAEHLPAAALARKVIEELSMTPNLGLIQAIGGAIEFLRKEEQKDNQSAVDFLIEKGREEIQAGGAPNRFFFDDRKWRKKIKTTKLDKYGGHYEGTTYVNAKGQRLPNYTPMG